MDTMTIEIVANRIAELEKSMNILLANIGNDEKQKKDKKEKSSKEEKPKKKRGMTGYLLFSKENRDDVKAELGEVKPTEVVTEVAKRWKAIGDEEREKWNKRAKEINDEGVIVD